MYLLALVYCLAAGGVMAFELWREHSYGGGNHWVYFGTPLDRLIQTVGLRGLLALCAPPLLGAIVAFARSDVLWGAILALACMNLSVVIYFFAIMALD